MDEVVARMEAYLKDEFGFNSREEFEKAYETYSGLDISIMAGGKHLEEKDKDQVEECY